MRRLISLFLGMTCMASAALAQEDGGAMADRLNRLERDINFLQKQVYRATNDGASEGSDQGEITTAPPPNAGHLDVRLSQMDEQIRQIRGQIEQVQFATKQIAVDLKKFTDDADYRLRALEQKQAASDAAAATHAASAPATIAEAPPSATTEEAEKPAVTGNDFPNANAQYSAAFKLLNEKKHSEAAIAFDAFVKKYPSDPLTTNAYYWLGESYYARADYTRAADSFRKGFEVNPEAAKAPDNLLKLALSLHQVKRTNEACIVLSQIATKYADTAPRTLKRSETARADMKCK
jgi:tol-pal system protein YbgF